MTRNRRLRLIDALLYSTTAAAAAAAAGSVRLIFPLPSFLCCCCCWRRSERFSAPGRIQSGTFLTFRLRYRLRPLFVCVYPPSLSLSIGRENFSLSPFCAVVSRPLPSPSPRPSRVCDVFWGVRTGGKRGGGEGELHTHTHVHVHTLVSAGLCVDVGGEGTLVVPGLSRRPVLSLPLSSFLVKTALWPRPFALLCVLLCVCCVFLVTHEKEKFKGKTKQPKKIHRAINRKVLFGEIFHFLIETTT